MLQVYGWQRLVCGLWAEDEIVVRAGVAAPGRGGIILGVRVCVWAGVLEGLGSGCCVIPWTVGVSAKHSAVLVGGLTEALQVVDGAGGSSTLVAIHRVVDDVDGLDGCRQVVGVLHRAGAASRHKDSEHRQHSTNKVHRSQFRRLAQCPCTGRCVSCRLLARQAGGSADIMDP